MRRTTVGVILLLGAVGLVTAVLLAFRGMPRPRPLPEAASSQLVWSFEAPQPGFVVGSPTISDDAIYLAASHQHGFQRGGAVYALDPRSGKTRWVYHHDGDMLPTVSTPLLARGLLFVGEGMHNNFSCRLHAIDARTGACRWTFPTTDHVEGGAAIANELVLVPAGNDGLYALDMATGQQRWNFRADLHIDSTPCVKADRVFVGSGPSRRFDALQIVCLEASSGKPIWRTPVALPAWGAPAIEGDRVFVGLGNGRLTEPAPKPAGGLACLDARTGELKWTFFVPDAVFGRPVIVAGRVVFGSRDENLYGVSFDGKELFRVAMGGPVLAPPVSDGQFVYAVSVPGRIVCVDGASGNEVWRYELKQRGSEARVYSGPRVADHRLFVAGEMMAGSAGVVCLHCFQLPENTR